MKSDGFCITFAVSEDFRACGGMIMYDLERQIAVHMPQHLCTICTSRNNGYDLYWWQFSM